MCCCSSHTRVSQARQQGEDVGVAPLTIVPGSVASISLPSSTTLGPAGQEVLLPKGWHFHMGHSRGSTEAEVGTATWQPGLFTPVNQQAKGSLVPFGWSILTLNKNPGCDHTVEVRRNVSGIQGLPWSVLVLPYTVIKFNGKLQLLIWPGLLMALALQEERFRSPHLARNLDQTRCLLRAGGIWDEQWIN